MTKTFTAPAHTPGPWDIVEYGPGEALNAALYRIDSAEFVALADVIDQGGVDGETLANARLITAAPQLLEALIALRTVGNPENCATADAAIAKAQGIKMAEEALGDAEEQELVNMLDVPEEVLHPAHNTSPQLIDLSQLSRFAKHKLAVQLLREISEEWQDSDNSEKWQNEHVEEYGSTMSFDELVWEVDSVEFKQT